MSRQPINKQALPLFLNQRQYQQLERSFTDPLNRRIAALQAQIANTATFPNNANQLVGNVAWTNESCIVWCSFTDGFTGGTLNPPFNIAYYEDENQVQGPITIPNGATSALIVFNGKQHTLWVKANNGEDVLTPGIAYISIDYDEVYNNNVLVFI